MEPTILNQRYRLVELVGAGGMATVYRGQDLLLERNVAVKFLREPYAGDPVFRERFLHEARAAARLDHPNIVHIYDVGEDEDHHPFIVMEMVAGEDLKALIRREGPLSVLKALSLTRQICAGVGHAHRAGIIHCDLKPQNILVTQEGQIKVADFGIARAFQQEEPTSPIGQEKVVWGSPHYISPEQVAGKTPTPASDVYSIGVILYEMLTGVPPFHAQDPTELVMKHLREEPAPLSSLNPRVPPGLEWVVRKVLAKESAQRYRNADQLGIAIDEYLHQGTHQTIPQPAVTGATPIPPTRAPAFAESAARSPELESADDTQPVAVREGPDYMLWALLAVAAIAVIGLVPLWIFVYQAYSQSAPIPTPPTTTLTPTASSDVMMVSVPNLLGVGAADAQRLAEGLGLKIEVLGEQESADARPGAILEQTPSPGSHVPVNSTISVILAAGRAFTLPDVVGYELDTIRSGLEDEGLLLTIDEIWSTEPSGQVLMQDPPAGSEVRAGDTITLTTSGGVNQPIPLQVNLNNQIMLEEARVSRLIYHPGDSVPVTLRWRSLQQVDRSYKIFVHLLTLDMNTLIAQQDIEPVNGLRPTSTWTPGDIINDPHQVVIPQNTPAGTYQIRVGLYTSDGRMPVVDPGQTQVVADTIFITSIEVQP